MGEAFSRVFTLEVDGRPILAFEAKQAREAQEMCKEGWLLEDLANLKSGGAPLRSTESKLSVRPATPEEIAIFEEVAEEPSEDLTLAFLVELDGHRLKRP